jgi:MSHA biogenesis protein MshQ
VIRRNFTRALSLLLWLTLAWSGCALAATCTSLNSGNWNTGATWSCGQIPQDSDNVVIANTHTITLDANSKEIGSLTINAGGTLQGNNTGTTLIMSAGPAAPITNNGTINFTGAQTAVIRLGQGNSQWGGSATSTWNLSTLNLNTRAVTFASGASFTINWNAAANPFSGFGSINTSSINSTVTFNFSGANQTLQTANIVYPNLTLSGSGTKTPNSGTVTVAGDFALNNGITYAGNTNNPAVNLAGDFSDSGTFNSGTGIYTFNGTAVQSLTGTATTTTFARLTMNNTAAAAANQDLTINHDITVSTTLAFTKGRIVTGAFEVIIPSGGTVTGAGALTGFVAGRLQRFVAAGASTVAFDVGTDGAASPALAYSPVSLTFTGVGAGGGNLIVSSTLNDHPNIASSDLDATKSVNRYWTLTTSGVTGTALPAFTNLSATFNFVAADVDAGATSANFTIDRWSGAAWSNTTNGTRNATNTQATGIAALGDFAVAEKVSGTPTPGSFNVFETTTVAPAITGVIKTKVAGSSFSLAVVAISAGAQQNSFTNNVKLELLANSGTPGAGYGADNCPTANTVIQTIASAAISGGRSTVSFSAVTNAYKDVRVRVSFPTTSPTVTSCSTDSFAMRPGAFTNFSVTDNDAQTAGTVRTLNNVVFTAGGVLHKSGRNFTVSADAVNAAATPAITTNYSDTPTATLSACGAGAACTSTFGTLTLGATFTAGQLVTNAASYTQVGSFALQLADSSFANIDSADGSTVAERTIQSAAINVGRFVPDHFAVTINTPSFTTGCATGTFTYVGQTFGYATPPVITVTAQDASNNTTTLYTGSWWRITNADLTGKTYTALSGTLDTSGITGTDPAIAESAGSPGTGTLTFNSGSGLFFTRTTPVTPFNAEISLSINVIDADGIAYATNPARFGAAAAGNGIAFSSGKEQRFGRLRLQNANGSQLIAMPIPLSAQYWNGSGFVTNTPDNCTTITAANIAIGNPLPVGFAVGSPTTGGVLIGGIGTLRLPATGAGTHGSVDVSVNLTGGTAGASCIAGMPTSTGANRAYLQGAWCGAGYTNDPTARATFGVYRNADKFIYQRENY